jgi:glyoxylase-like metal-dependent hydrolase (beta-lactamase superfamily II)
MLTFRVTQPGRVLLFPGDTFFHGGRIALQNIPDCDIPAYTASLRRVSQLDFDMLFPGHGLWSLSNGYRHIAEAMKFVDRLLLPPNL